MKLKYFLPAFIAAIAMLFSCSDDDSITKLPPCKPDVRLSKSVNPVLNPVKASLE